MRSSIFFTSEIHDFTRFFTNEIPVFNVLYCIVLYTWSKPIPVFNVFKPAAYRRGKKGSQPGATPRSARARQARVNQGTTLDPPKMEWPRSPPTIQAAMVAVTWTLSWSGMVRYARYAFDRQSP